MIEFIFKYWLEFLFSIIIGIITSMFKTINSYKKRLINSQNGVKVLLKTKIIENYNRLMNNGYITLHEKQNINELYTEYQNLGGNGVIKDLIDEINDLNIKTFIKEDV